MPSSGASDSSGTTAGPSTPSGRSTPDAGQINVQSFKPANATFGAYGAFGSFTPRRSSTPAQAFLPPRFWQQTQYADGSSISMGNAHQGAGTGAETKGTAPRRTSFGTALGSGNRLNVLSAFGMSPATPMYNYKGPQSPRMQPQSHAQPLTQAGVQGTSGRDSAMSASGAGAGSAVDSATSTPVPSAPSSPIVQPKRQRSICFLPGPDGLCVEDRGRRKSEA